MNQIFTLRVAPSLKRMALALLFLGTVALVQAATWYSTATTTANSTAVWWSNTNGTGSHPSNFTTSGDIFIIQTGHTATTNNNWTIGTGVTLQLNGTGKLVINGNNDVVTITGTIVFANANATQVTLAGAGGGNFMYINGTLKTANANGVQGTNASLPVNATKKTVVLSEGANYEFNGATQTTTGLPAIVSTLTITNAGTKTLAANVDVRNDFTINTNATFDVSASNRTLKVGRNWLNNGTLIPGTGTVTFDGVNQTINTSTTSNFYNLTLSGAGTKTLLGTLRIANNLNVSTTRTILDLGIYVADNISASPTGTLSVVGGATLKVGGGHVLPQNYSNNGYQFDPTSTVEFYGAGTRAVAARTYGNLKISDDTRLIADGALTIAGDLTIGSLATFDATNSSANNYTHNINGNWINNGTFNASTTTINFKGTTTPQIIGGAASTTFENLSVNNSTGIIIDKTAFIDADGVVTFGAGLVTTTAAKLLVFNDNAKVAGVSDASFVNGPVRKLGNDIFRFPVGKFGTGYQPIEISAPVPDGGTFTAEYIRESANTKGPITANGLQVVSNCEYWTLDRTTGSPDVDVTLFWNENSDCGTTYITNASSIVVAHNNGTSWNSYGRDGGSTGNGTEGSVTWKNVSTFSPFTIGSIDAVLNPLPVTFISFEGRKVANGTQLTWKVAGEVAVKAYEVERSANGNSGFAKIGSVPATGSSSYTFTDAASHSGVVFYRIKNVDNDGKSKYSTYISFSNGAGSVVFRVLPTVVTSRTSVQHAAGDGAASISISTADGRQVKLQRPAAGSIKTDVDMSNLRAGMYLLRYSDGKGHIETVKLVKQ